MTKNDALLAVVGMEYSLPVAEKAFLDRDILGTDDYSLDDVKEIDLIAIDILQILLITPSFTEGGMTVKYDYKAIQARLSYLTGKYPEDVPVVPKTIPKIRGVSVW
jgi:hypothetical protein